MTTDAGSVEADLVDQEITGDTEQSDGPRSSPPSGRLSQWFEWSNKAAGLLARLVFVGAVAITAFEYFEATQRERTERTFALVELWDSERIQSAHNAIQQARLSIERENRAVLDALGDPDDRGALERIVADGVVGSAYGADPDIELRASLETLLYFLNRVAHCVAAELCEPEIADVFFLEYASSFWALFGEGLAHERPQSVAPLREHLAARAFAP